MNKLRKLKTMQAIATFVCIIGIIVMLFVIVANDTGLIKPEYISYLGCGGSIASFVSLAFLIIFDMDIQEIEDDGGGKRRNDTHNLRMLEIKHAIARFVCITSVVILLFLRSIVDAGLIKPEHIPYLGFGCIGALFVGLTTLCSLEMDKQEIEERMK